MTITKRILFILLITLFLLLSGCSPSDTVTCYAESDAPTASPTAEPTPVVDTVEVTMRVIDASGSSMLLASMDSTSVYRNTLPDGKTYPVGTLLQIICADSVLETYPAQLAQIYSAEPMEDHFDDRCALYLQVLEDLWTQDQALQADTEYVGIDLSQTSLSNSEQAAIAWRFGELHGKEPLSATFEELCEDGFIDKENLYWEEGCLLSITETETANRSVTFTAQKWRSGLGAIFFTDCTAEQDASGHWDSYTAGGFAIS